MKLIDKDKVVDEIERIKKEECSTDSYEGRCKLLWFEQFLSFINSLEIKEVITEQECTCNEALNCIIGGSWNLLCPVNKLGLKTGDKVKVIIETCKRE